MVLQRMRRPLRFAGRYAVALAGAAYAFTLGVAAGRHRRLIASLATHFGYDDHPPRTLPQVVPDDVTAADTAVVLPAPDAAEGNVTLFELLILARLVRERKPTAIFEFGTFDGRTTLTLAANADAHVVVRTLDLAAEGRTSLPVEAADRGLIERREVGRRFRDAPEGRRIQQLLGDSATVDLDGVQADFVFVDASHAYRYVINDSHRALRLLPPAGGTIVWHDYGAWEGVTRALNELQATDPSFAGARHIRGTTLVVLFRS